MTAAGGAAGVRQKKLVQMGRQGACDVASASVCVTKPTWNMKHRLERQREQEWRREAAELSQRRRKSRFRR